MRVPQTSRIHSTSVCIYTHVETSRWVCVLYTQVICLHVCNMRHCSTHICTRKHVTHMFLYVRRTHTPVNRHPYIYTAYMQTHKCIGVYIHISIRTVILGNWNTVNRGAVKSEISRQDLREEPMLQPESEDHRRQRSLLGGNLTFSLLRPSTDQTRPTHSMSGNSLCLKSTDLSVISSEH